MEEPVPTSLVAFLEIWPLSHSISEIWQALQEGDNTVLIWDEDMDSDDDDESEGNASENESPEDDCDSVDLFIGTVLQIFEVVERLVSWNRRGQANLEAALFCYGAFGLGRHSFLKTVEKRKDSFEWQLIPSYELLESTAAAVHVHPLSVSMIQFSLWYLIGFHRTQLERLSGADTTNRTSRSLSLKEFESGVLYEKLQFEEEACCIFVSHRWQTPIHPDPDKIQRQEITKIAQKVQDYLETILDVSKMSAVIPEEPGELVEMDMDPRVFALMKLITSDEFQFAIQFFIRKQYTVRLWYDYYSIPQGTDNKSRLIRSKCLGEITSLCRRMIFLGLISDDYFTRGWCAFELIQHTGSTTKIGTKLCTNYLEPPLHSIDETAYAFLSQMYTDFRTRSIHGRLCGLLEDQSPKDSTTVLLKDLNVRCTNGSDLRFLSRALVEQIHKQDTTEESLVWLHPFLSATGRLLEESLVPPILSNKRRRKITSELRPKQIPKALVKFCFAWRNEIRTYGHDDAEEALAAKVTLKWRYPDNCLDHLLETRLDFENIPDFFQNLQRGINVLEELREALRTHSVQETWEDCKAGLQTSLVERVEALLDAPGYFVQLAFSGG